MKHNNNPDQQEATIVVTFNGGICHNALVMKDQPFPTFPSFQGDKEYSKLWKKHSKQSNYNPTTLKHQFVINNLPAVANIDNKSLKQQVGDSKKNHRKTDWILAAIISRIWDQSNGKLDGSFVSYSSNTLNFQAKFDSERNKYIVI